MIARFIAYRIPLVLLLVVLVAISTVALPLKAGVLSVIGWIALRRLMRRHNLSLRMLLPGRRERDF